jgi:hypothetical protein
MAAGLLTWHEARARDLAGDSREDQLRAMQDVHLNAMKGQCATAALYSQQHQSKLYAC